MFDSGVFLLFERLFFFIGAIGNGGNAFPRPLKQEEEEECIRQCINGSLDAKNKLIVHNLRLVAHIAKKYAGTGENDDIISIGTVGLIKAVSTYRPDKGIQLATYASKCVENEIRMNLRSAKKRKNDVYLDEPVGTDKEGNSITLAEIIGTETDCVMESAESVIACEKLLRIIRSSLAKRERIIIEMRYGIGNKPVKTQREIAHMLGISRSYVSRIEKAALKRGAGTP